MPKLGDYLSQSAVSPSLRKQSHRPHQDNYDRCDQERAEESNT